MSTASATLVVLAIYAIGLAPVAWAVRPHLAAKWPAIAFSSAIVALGLVQTGLLARSSFTDTAVGSLMPDQSAGGRCREVLDVAKEAGIILDFSQPGKLSVSQAFWPQIPVDVRDAIVECAAQVAPPPPATAPDETVETPGVVNSPNVEIILR